MKPSEFDLPPEKYAEFRRMKALQGDYNFCPWLISPAELDELQELKKQFKDYLQ